MRADKRDNALTLFQNGMQFSIFLSADRMDAVKDVVLHRPWEVVAVFVGTALVCAADFSRHVVGQIER